MVSGCCVQHAAPTSWDRFTCVAGVAALVHQCPGIKVLHVAHCAKLERRAYNTVATALGHVLVRQRPKQMCSLSHSTAGRLGSAVRKKKKAENGSRITSCVCDFVCRCLTPLSSIHSPQVFCSMRLLLSSTITLEQSALLSPTLFFHNII